MRHEQTARFRARREECASVLAFVESAARGLDERLACRLRLAAEELFLNTVTHGHGGDSDAPVDVTIKVEGDRVALVYADSGPPFDPFAGVQPPDPAAAVEARPEGRLGLFLVTALAERCHYAREGDRNHVTVELRAPG